MSHIQHQLFFDPNLTHEQCIHLLKKLNGIEAEFLCILYDFVKELNISKDSRDDLENTILDEIEYEHDSAASPQNHNFQQIIINQIINAVNIQYPFLLY